MITLRQLRYFQALARFRHFGQAAEHCAVTQPALSMQIKELERELGVDLVERRATGVALTPAGEEIAGRAAAILAAVRELAETARRRRGVLVGPLRLGLIPSAAPYLLPRLLKAAALSYPSLELLIRESQTSALLEELLRGDLDAAVVALPIGEPEVRSEPLFEDPFFLAVPAHAARAWSAGCDLAHQMSQERLLLLEEGHCLRDQALQFCQMANVQARRALGAASLATILQMVAAGQGVTLLPELCAEAEVDRGRVALIPFPEDPPKRVLGLVWRKSSGRVEDFAALAALIRQARAPLGASSG